MEKPVLIKQLSNHHWLLGELVMLETKQLYQEVAVHVGNLDIWKYYLVRSSIKSSQVYRYTVKNDKIVQTIRIDLLSEKEFNHV
jgi:hypothetical protein